MQDTTIEQLLPIFLSLMKDEFPDVRLNISANLIESISDHVVFWLPYCLIQLCFVFVSLSGWGLLFFGGYKFFTRGKKNKEERKRVTAENGKRTRVELEDDGYRLSRDEDDPGHDN
ncbi:hypothetical protein RHMOL_Rhmol01G0194700 [Rhododendron molle]|uniref:Uncharacterized protein n=2 Tax=Rhododendron molle TaxID=49168 RepID=A0ACC0Q2Y2_RHOML|nr:hypothetical protein RHMOL_Rhmol01G0194700 [Rhododendron molle]KAI8572389.1 hypothetical protein RHMOL_Rhmol01G0194700 [Rhododendron molle]